MPSDTGCQNNEQGFDGYVLADGHGAIDECYPNHGDGKDFGMQRNGAMLAEIADIVAEVFLTNEPLV